MTYTIQRRLNIKIKYIYLLIYHFVFHMQCKNNNENKHYKYWHLTCVQFGRSGDGGARVSESTSLMDVRPYIFSNKLLIQNKQPLRHYSASIYSLLLKFIRWISYFYICCFQQIWKDRSGRELRKLGTGVVRGNTKCICQVSFKTRESLMLDTTY